MRSTYAREVLSYETEKQLLGELPDEPSDRVVGGAYDSGLGVRVWTGESLVSLPRFDELRERAYKIEMLYLMRRIAANTDPTVSS